MTKADDPNQPVVATTAATIEQADLIAATLKAAGIEAFIANAYATSTLPHCNLSLNRKGIEVYVRKSDLQAANELLAKMQENAEVRKQTEGEPNLTDDYGEAAVKSMLFSLIFSPMWLVAVYYYIKANKSKRNLPPTNETLFRKNMAKCAWGVILLAAGFLLLVGFIAYYKFNDYYYYGPVKPDYCMPHNPM